MSQNSFAKEFWDIYELEVIVIPTNRPIQRDDRNDLVYKTAREKFNAVIDEIEVLVNQKRPVLVGTTTVEISELGDLNGCCTYKYRSFLID